MAMSLSLIGRIRGLLPFSGVIFTIFRSVSMCVVVSCVSSPILIPVSFSVCSMAANILLLPAMSMSISCSVGMNGSFWLIAYFGGVHVFPMECRNMV